MKATFTSWNDADYFEGRAIKKSPVDSFREEPACRVGEYITDIGGYPYQMFFYSSFGEALVAQHANSGDYEIERMRDSPAPLTLDASAGQIEQNARFANTNKIKPVGWQTPYRFNGKEIDPEIEPLARFADTNKNQFCGPQTGLAYYGARFYEPKTSIWLSVDPLAMSGKNQTMSPYQFTDNNPVMLIDPDGRKVKVARKNRDQVNQYFSEQFGEGVFTVKRSGKVKLNKRAFRRALESADPNRRDLLLAMKETVKHDKVAEIEIGDGGDMIITRNPQDWDEATESFYPRFIGEYGEEGRKYKLDYPGSATFDDPDYENTIIGISEPNSTFDSNSESNEKTNSSPSSLLLHELLDHFYEENILGNPDNSSGVKWHNKALENVGENKLRNGEDHD